jgi:hypothetical protein
VTTRTSAGFDALAITGYLERTAGGAGAAEIHVFAYLACTLSLYDRRSPSEWLYGFSATPAGTPYSPVLAEECDRLRASGRLIEEGEALVLSEVGRRDHDTLRSFLTITYRVTYLEAACAASALLPLPSVRHALSFDPQLAAALLTGGPRELMQPERVALVSEQLHAVREMLHEHSPQTHDLLIPTMVWLTYLSESRK